MLAVHAEAALLIGSAVRSPISPFNSRAIRFRWLFHDGKRHIGALRLTGRTLACRVPRRAFLCLYRRQGRTRVVWRDSESSKGRFNHAASSRNHCVCRKRHSDGRSGAGRRIVDRIGRHRQRPAGASRNTRPVREEHRQQGNHRRDAVVDDRPVRPVQALACGRKRRHRRLSDRRHLGAAARQPVRRSDRGDQGRRRRPFPVDHRIADRQRQARRAADLHRCAGALLPQGPPRQIRRQGADHLGGTGRHRQARHGQGARGRQQGHVGLRLPGQRL